MPQFLELWLDNTAVRSHALPSAGKGANGRRAQSFTLPLRRADCDAGSGGSSYRLSSALCLTLCDADGDSGGRPLALSIANTNVTELPPFTPTSISCALTAPPFALAYCHASGHCGRRGAEARAQWLRAWRACSSDADALADNANHAGGDFVAGGSAIAGHGAAQRRSVPSAATSAAGIALAAVRLVVEWRPMPRDDGRGPAGTPSLFDPLGFPIDDGSMPAAAAAAAAAPRLQRRPSYTSAYATPMAAAAAAAAIDEEGEGANGSRGGQSAHGGGGSNGDGISAMAGGGGGSGSEEVRPVAGLQRTLSSLQAAAHGRLCVGNWWAHDALHLCRWNALLCSCASLDEVPSSRLRYLLAGGVPLQHRMHVWEACAAAASLRAAYARYHRPKGEDEGGVAPGGEAAPGSAETAASDVAAGAVSACATAVDAASAEVVADMAAAPPPPPNPPPNPPPPPAPLPPLPPEDDAAFLASARVVEKDLLRTLPSHPFFNQMDAPLVGPLRRVLLAFARHVPAVSYCQGLNFVAAVLLLHGDEACAFGMLCALCERVLPHYHSPSMLGLLRAQDTLLSLVRHAAPRAHARLASEGVPVREQTTAWLLCAFVEALPLEAALRVWDLLYFDGEVALLRAAAAAFALGEPALLASPECTFDLRGVLEGCDAGELVQASLEPSLCAAAEAGLVAAGRLHEHDHAQASS